jgi:cyclopropane-fatty-acyl-phospholipid synthase
MLLDATLRRLIRVGDLTLIDADGKVHRFTGAPGPTATIRLKDKALEREILLTPDPAVGDAYMDGRLVLEHGDLLDFVMIGFANVMQDGWHGPARWWQRVNRALRRLHQWNTQARARRNVAHHYDLSGELYALFLDSERQYTCAYHATGREDIEAAQRAKERHIAAKLLIGRGQKIIDLGCGWGSLALFLAREYDVDVTGVTLSIEQATWANEQARQLGLDRRARFLHQDYRDAAGAFDRVVSIGMLEHVGLSHYQVMFGKIGELLKPEGVALVHSIGRASGPGYTSPWIRKHIFPGGYIPALSEVLPVIEQSGFWITDIEILRLHYAETLRLWREKFHANRERVQALYDERFCRMWDFYLVGSEAFFRVQDGMNFQIQLAKERHVVPLTRDYIVDHERAYGVHGAWRIPVAAE